MNNHVDGTTALGCGRRWRRLGGLLGMLRLGLGLGLGLGHAANSETTRTQDIELQAGWNAVFLEVQAAQDKPAALFQGLPVSTVACLVPGSRDDQFVRRPGDAPWKAENWVVWHAPGRPESFLSNLHRLSARRAYLVQATAACVWRVQGEVRAPDIAWQPNTFTLTGLPVEPDGGMTFGAFFEGSVAHAALRIFRLEAGEWRLLRDARTEAIRSGEAYWIETLGASTHQGPVALRLPAPGELDFDTRGAIAEVRVENLTTRPVRVRLESVGGARALRLKWVRRPLGSATSLSESIDPAVELPELAARASLDLRLAPDREAMSGPSASTLLRISDGCGWERWIPVRARRETLVSRLQP